MAAGRRSTTRSKPASASSPSSAGNSGPAMGRLVQERDPLGRRPAGPALQDDRPRLRDVLRLGMAVQAMGGGDMFPGTQSGTIDAAPSSSALERFGARLLPGREELLLARRRRALLGPRMRHQHEASGTT
jgi:hypothetical protein